MLAFTCIFGLDEGSRWWWMWRAGRDWSATTTTATATTLICFCPPIQAFKHQDRNIQHTTNLIGYGLVWWLYVQYTRKHEWTWHEYIYKDIHNIYTWICICKLTHDSTSTRFEVPLGSSNYYLVLRLGSGLGVVVLSSSPTKLRLLLLLLLDVIGVVFFSLLLRIYFL